MMLMRRIASAFVGVYAFSCIGALVTVKLIGSGATAGAIVTGVVALIGAYGGWTEGKKLVDWSTQERRDAIIGWGIVIAIIGAVVSGLVPMPWTIPAAAAWVLITVLTCRALLVDSASSSSPES